MRNQAGASFLATDPKNALHDIVAHFQNIVIDVQGGYVNVKNRGTTRPITSHMNPESSHTFIRFRNLICSSAN